MTGAITTGTPTDLWSTDLVSLPFFEVPEPSSRVLSDPRPPTSGGTCGNCGGPVAVPYAGQPGLSEGYCPRCGTHYSFEPKLRQGELVADQFEVVGCLAHGGLGWVYLARDLNLDGEYRVLKGLIDTNNADALELAIAERRFLTRLHHQNIVSIVTHVTHPDPHTGELTGYIVMEYVGGRSLREIKHLAISGKPLRVEHIIGYGCEILLALEYLHGEGLLYCDMKPDNVIHSDNGIKLIDLGGVRRIGDRDSPVVGTPPYQVSRQEISTRGLTVRSDIRTVGKTLEELLEVCADRLPAADNRMAPGVESFRRVISRATSEYERRFASAALMSEQLQGVLREILALRDGNERPAPSSMFTPTAVLLDAGLGAAPQLSRWTGPGPGPGPGTVAGRRHILADGRPEPQTVAAGLPVPRVDPADPAAAFLSTVSASDPVRLIRKLAPGVGETAWQDQTAEIEFCRCRAQLQLHDNNRAQASLTAAGEALGVAGRRHNWRWGWHRALLALARGRVPEAQTEFDEVYALLPGEDAPKLALGYCAEALGEPERAEALYQAVWRRDRSQASAAFGLARIRLSRADRTGAVEILDQVPAVSRHYDAARIAAVRVHSEYLPAANGDGQPTAADFQEVVGRLPNLYLDQGEDDGDARRRLAAVAQEVALDRIRELGPAGLPRHGGTILGSPPTERWLRDKLADALPKLAQKALTADDHALLVDLGNAIRHRSLT